MSDDPTDVIDIADDDDLYRRIAPDHVDPDGSVNSGAFKYRGRPANRISVDLARLTTPAAALAPRPTFGLGSLTAGDPRRLGLAVHHEPIPGNTAHSVIEGQSSKAICRQMAEATSLIISPDPERLS